mgnify:FL=1
MTAFIEQFAAAAPARLIAAAMVALLVFLGYKMAARGIYTLNTTGKLKKPFKVMRRMLRWGAILVGLLLVLQTLGVLKDAWTMVTAVFTLVAVGFVAMWSVLSHALCSVILMFSGPFEVGDTIEFGETPDIRGEVVDFSLLFTALRDKEGHLVQIPNNTFFQKIVRREVGSATRSLEQQVDEEYAPHPDEPVD